MSHSKDCYFARNNMVFTLNEMYEINTTCNTEDWKTALARPKDYPDLKKGHKVTFIEDFHNLYGNFAEVKPEGMKLTYYINYSNLSIIKKDEA